MRFVPTLYIAALMLAGASHAHARSCNVEAGPIWNNAYAQGKYPRVCGDTNRQWTGQWRTTVQGQMSVCQCR